MEALNDKLLALLAAKDDLAFKFGDTLDVKASIGMVVITFLSTQTAYLLDKHVNGVSHALQSASVLFLVFATIATIIELWPRTYVMIEPESNVASRIPELEDFYLQHKEAVEPSVLAQITLEEIEWTKARIAANQSKNSLKARWLVAAFYGTAAAIVLNTATVVVVWITHPF